MLLCTFVHRFLCGHNFFKQSSGILFFFWLCWVFIAAQGLSLVTVSRGSSLVAVHRFLIVVASLWALGHAGFSSCDTWAEFLRGMWNHPRLVIETISLALTGGFLTTGPPGNSWTCFPSLGYIPRNETAGSYVYSVFNFLRNHRSIFNSGCTILHSHQHWEHNTEDFPRLHQHLFSGFLNSVILLKF